MSPAPRHLPPQLPWLLLPYDPHLKEGDYASLRFFYDMSNFQMHQINLPETCGKQYCGSSQGWLVLEDGPEISLLNPITRVQMQLPSINALPKIWGASGIESEDARSQFGILHSRYGYKEGTGPIIQRIILTSSPTLDPDCVVMALFKSIWGLAFCRIGDESWTLFEAPAQNGIGHRLIDATYHNGLFYCLSIDEVKIYDLKGATCEVLNIIIPLEHADYHLIEGGIEELLLVAQHWAPHGLCKRYVFSIYKLGIKEEEDKPDWIEKRGIGETTCFICEGIEQCFTFPMDNLQMPAVLGVGANRVCYACPVIVEKNRQDFGWGWHPEDRFGYDIESVKVPPAEIPALFSDYWTDYVIQLVKSFGYYPTTYSRALWITPSFY